MHEAGYVYSIWSTLLPLPIRMLYICSFHYLGSHLNLCTLIFYLIGNFNIYNVGIYSFCLHTTTHIYHYYRVLVRGECRVHTECGDASIAAAQFLGLDLAVDFVHAFLRFVADFLGVKVAARV